MWNVAAWLAVGLTLALVGGMLLSLDDESIDVVAWCLFGVGAIVAQIGVIGMGVLVGLREHTRDQA